MGERITGSVHDAPGAMGGNLLTAATLRAALEARGRSSQKVTIDHLEAESIGDPPEMRQVVHFRGTSTRLVLNSGNTKTLCERYGPRAADWEGKTIWLRVEATTFRGQAASGVRISTDAPTQGGR